MTNLRAQTKFSLWVILFVFSLGLSPAWGAHWIELGKTDDGVFYIDAGSVVHKDGRKIVWTKWVWSPQYRRYLLSGDGTKAFKQTCSQTHYQLYRESFADDATYTILSVQWFNKSNQCVHSVDRDEHPRNAAPDSMEWLVYYMLFKAPSSGDI